MTRSRLVLLLVLLAAIVAFFWFDLGRFLSLEFVKAQQAQAAALYAEHPLAFLAGFFLLYVVVTGLSLPGAAVLTLLAGALFGFVTGTILVSFASTIGATLAFLSSRFLLRDWVRARFGASLRTIDEGFTRDSAFYLFTLRLVPAFPFFAINLLMGLTQIRARTFFWVSQIGMLAGTLAYVNAGTQLARIDSLRGILSPGLIASFVILGVLPLVARRAIDAIRARRVYARWPRPRRFDRNLVVIGAGSAGLVTAYIAAAVKAKVTLVEKHRMGGDCLNTGCVPSKALIKASRLMHEIARAPEFGIATATPSADFPRVMARVHEVIRTVEPHDSVERYTALGVECLQGSARIVSPWQVEVTTEAGTQTLSTRAIVIAAGARPFVPPIPGIEDTGYLTSDTVWGLRELPARLMVLGGGPIGVELAQAFARLGSRVTLVEKEARILVREDPEVAELVRAQLAADGIELRTGCEALAFDTANGARRLRARGPDGELTLEFDTLLCALGRVANTSGYGLEELGIGTTARRTVDTNEYLETLYPNIYAAGDVAGPYQFTHVAAHQAWYAAVNALFGRWRGFRADYSVIPAATFCDPEVARVGLNETEARAQNIAYEVTHYGIDDLDRAIADGVAHGFVKVLTVPGKDRILGATIVGEHAADLLAEFVLAMRHGIGLNKLLGTIHIYPTLAEANKYAAGNWKRSHAPQGLLRWVERYHAWMRGA